MTDKELLQEALDAILVAIKSGDWKVDGACDPDFVINALRARLSQPEQEPVAWISCNAGLYHGKPDESLKPLPLYTASLQREWVGLTDDDFLGLTTQQIFAMKFAEAKLKEKNT